MMIISDEQIVSVRTMQGVQLYQFLTDGFSKLKWTWALRETSICELAVPPTSGYVRIPDVTPWLHWVDVWDGNQREMYWSGPILRAEQGRDWLSITARDVSAFGGRTRCPVSSRWDSADPAEIAEVIWEGMIRHHGLNLRPTTRLDPRGDRFKFECRADEKMAEDVLNELVDLGMYWSVVQGVPLLGPESTRAAATLGEDDFVSGGLSVIRDGANTYNDVLLRVADAQAIARRRETMGGLSLQTIVTIDDMFGVGNAERAVQQKVRHTGGIRDAISVPSGATLHPDAPITLEQLRPSTRLNVSAFGLLTLMEVEGVTSQSVEGNHTLGVDLESVDDDLPELDTVAARR